MLAESDGGVVRGGQGTLARSDLAFQTFQRGGAQGAAMNTDRTGIGDKTEAFQLADGFAADGNAAGFIQSQRSEFIVAQMLHQHRSAAVDESLCKSFMQRIRQPVFHRPGDALPMDAVTSPA